MPKTEFHNIERFEDRERQFGITIKGLLVVIEEEDGTDPSDDEHSIDLYVMGELHVIDESKMPASFTIVVSALNREEKIMAIGHAFYPSEDITGFASLECSVHDLMEKPTSVRIYPQK